MRCVWLIIFLVVGEITAVPLLVDLFQATSKHNLHYLHQVKTYESQLQLLRRGLDHKKKVSPSSSVASLSASGLGPPRQQRQPASSSTQAGSIRRHHQSASTFPSNGRATSASPPRQPSMGTTRLRPHEDLLQSQFSSGQAEPRSPEWQPIVRASRDTNLGHYIAGRMYGARITYGKSNRDLVSRLGNLVTKGGNRLLAGITSTRLPRKKPTTPATSTANPSEVGSQAVDPDLPGLRHKEPSLQDMGAAGRASKSLSHKNSDKAPGSPRFDHSVIKKDIGEMTLQRANSDPIRRRYPPVRKSRATVSKTSTPVVKPSATHEIVPDVPSAPSSVPSHTSFELDHPRNSRDIGSFARTTVGTSAFASLADGPAITGAGLRTTIDTWPSSEIPSYQSSRRTSAGSMGSYEVPGDMQPMGHNGGTAAGPQSLASKFADKMNIMGKYFGDRPGEAVRVSGSALGHTLLGVGPAVAKIGGVGAAGVVGTTGAALAFLSGNERIIPKIEQWQQDRGTAPMLRKPT